MKRNRDIRKFFAEHRPEVDGGERFMASLKRQIDLLPIPASMSAEEDLEKVERLNLLHAAMKTSLRRSILAGLGTLIAVACVVVLLYFTFFGNPDGSGTLDFVISDIPVHVTRQAVTVVFGLTLAVLSVLISLPRHWRT